MQSNHISPFNEPELRHGICVVDGHGAKLYVNRGHLVVEDGAGRRRRTRRFHKATAGISRVVMLARSGFVTIDAIQWLADTRIGLIHLDPDGRLLVSSAPPSRNDASLRRAQARVANTETGIEITRDILTTKIQGQAHVAQHINAKASARIEETLVDLARATSLYELHMVEAAAAATYWSALAGLRLQYVKADVSQVPDHWHTLGVRRSRISGSQRLAANPGQAMLNYLYALLEAEARIECANAGLDPALGILHVDQPSRDSLALDVMEAARPDVDQYVIDLITGHYFQKRDFYETRRGSCRINRRLTHALAETTQTWHKAVAPTVAALVKTLASDRTLWERPTPTRLTQTNRSAERASQHERPVRKGRGLPPMPGGLCVECGAVIPSRAKRCRPCHDIARTQRMLAGSRAAHERRKQTGHDPAHGGDAAKKRGATQTQRSRERQEWENSHKMPDAAGFIDEILPLLRSVPVRAMAAATGLTSGYCSLIRRGVRTPHPMHWGALRSTAASGGSAWS